MTLIVHELDATTLQQEVVPSRNTIVEAIRPHIYRHNFATGSLKIEIYDSLDSLVATSETIDISDIGTLAYFHGYVRFFINAYLTKGESYNIRLVGGDGYSFSESAYCGWVNGYDLGKYAELVPPTSSFHNSLDLEIWELKVK